MMSSQAWKVISGGNDFNHDNMANGQSLKRKNPGCLIGILIMVTSGQITIIPKPELRGFGGGFPY